MPHVSVQKMSHISPLFNASICSSRYACIIVKWKYTSQWHSEEGRHAWSFAQASSVSQILSKKKETLAGDDHFSDNFEVRENLNPCRSVTICCKCHSADHQVNVRSVVWSQQVIGFLRAHVSTHFENLPTLWYSDLHQRPYEELVL